MFSKYYLDDFSKIILIQKKYNILQKFLECCIAYWKILSGILQYWYGGLNK